MSDSRINSSSVFDGDEDNNPFPHTGLASLISSHREDPPTDAKAAFHAGSDQESTSPANGIPIKSPSLLSKSSSPSHSGSPDDNHSLLLYQNDDFNTIPIGHENRVAKMLAAGNKVQVVISEAGKSSEGMANASKKYIVYTIKLSVADSSDELQTRRRYSDFESLREILTQVFPLVIIPPIPPKNYFSLRVLNGLVGSGATSPTATGPSTSGADSPPQNGQSYSYINSNYLNKTRLIEHRKRLLANFLNNCLQIPQIRGLDFFAKFLDPAANWSDEIALITSQLPKSIFQSNPENGLNTDPLYSHLPLPVSNHAISLPFSNPLKGKILPKSYFGTATSPPNGTSESAKPQSEATTDPSKNAQQQQVTNSHLDDINRRIMANFVGLSNDYVELGTFLNSFSVILGEISKSKAGEGEQDAKLDRIFDKIGSAFDNSCITINSLMGELETKYSEPLGEAVKYTSVFEATWKFKDRKEKQNHLVDWELKSKKKELADNLRAELEVNNIENGLQAQSLNKPQTATSPSGMDKTGKGRFLSSISSVKKFTKYFTDIIDQNPEVTRKQRITHLQERIGTLEKCQKIMLQDLSFIADELDKNSKKFRKDELRAMFQILLNYNTIFIAWAKKNVDIWEEVREEIKNSSL